MWFGFGIYLRHDQKHSFIFRKHHIFSFQYKQKIYHRRCIDVPYSIDKPISVLNKECRNRIHLIENDWLISIDDDDD